MNVAFVYDRVNKFGGAERVLLALHKIWPNAPLYTAVYDPKRAPWAKAFDVRTSFLQHIPGAKNHHELFPWLTPLAFESFNFDGFDVVVSVTSAEAKNIITKPETLHICYCLTPTRYLWSGYDTYAAASRPLQILAPILRGWDRIASRRPDYYLAISERVKKRIETYYGREVTEVIYPPVDLRKFKCQMSNVKTKDNYFLTVSRLVGYKRVDIIIEAFNKLGRKLIIIGDGGERSTLQKAARKNIEFVTRHLTDRELQSYYQRCVAFVFAGDEDFGLVAAEAQAAGIPVICYKESGMAEIVEDGKTGMLFEEQTVEGLIAAVKRFSHMRYNKEIIQKHAAKFDQAIFTKAFDSLIQQLAAYHARRA